MTELLSCPFCGKPPFERWEDNRNGPKYPGHHFVWCENVDCGAAGEAMEETAEAAHAAWNTRAPNFEIETLRSQLGRTQQRLVETREALGELYKFWATHNDHRPDAPIMRRAREAFITSEQFALSDEVGKS